MNHWAEVSGLNLNLSNIDISKDIESLLEGISWEEIQEIDKGLKDIQDYYTARERIIATIMKISKVLIKAGVTLV